MLELTNLTVTPDGKTVVKDVTLNVERGKVTAVLGANGAGLSGVSRIGRAQGAACGHHVGRTTTDAGDRSRADSPPALSAA